LNWKWGDAPGENAGTGPGKAGAPVFAAGREFFAGVQGDKNAKSVTFCNPTRPHDAKNAISGAEKIWAGVTNSPDLSDSVTT
jgi:hypothetical protein